MGEFAVPVETCQYILHCKYADAINRFRFCEGWRYVSCGIYDMCYNERMQGHEQGYQLARREIYHDE